MKDNSREDELLYEVLGETNATSFRTGSRDHMLAALEQRRGHRRQIQGFRVALCLLATIGLLVSLTPGGHRPTLERPESLFVHSKPLPPGMILVTQPELISTISTVTSSRSSVALVEGLPPKDLFEIIGDDGLLALLGERPAALVQRGSAGAELVFVNPADANGFQIR